MKQNLMKRIQEKMKSKKGFTLIELIVVIAIIAILVAILVPNIVQYIRTARQTSANANAKTIATTMQTIITDRLTDNDATNNIPDDTYEITAANAAGETLPAAAGGTATITLSALLAQYMDGSSLTGALVSVKVTSGAVESVTYTDANNVSGSY